MTDRERIEAAVAQQGFTVVSWGTDDDGAYASLGQFEVTAPDDEDRGIYEGTTGELRASVVGAAEYNNQRVYFAFHEEGMDGGNEVQTLGVLSSVDV